MSAFKIKQTLSIICATIVSASTLLGNEEALLNQLSQAPSDKIVEPKTDDSMQGPFFIVDETPLNTIRILEELTGKVAIIAPNLPNVKINFETAGKLKRSEAINAFKSLLTTNGVMITPIGDKFFRATLMTGAGKQTPEFIVGSALDMKPSQSIFTKLYELKYAQLETLMPIFPKILAPDANATIAYFNSKNAFMISDTLLNHQRLETILKKIDTPATINEDIGVIMLKNMAAEDLKRRLQSFKSEIMRKHFERTTIEADERTNQVVIATTKGNLQNIKNIIEKLDIDAEPLTRSEVYYVRHGEAKDIESVLNSIVKGQRTAAKNAQKSRTAAANAQNARNRAINARTKTTSLPTNISADSTGASLQFSEYITIVSDERSNSIVAYGMPSDLKQIGDIISKIDVVLAQVKIDVIITEVTLTDNQTSGLSSLGLSYSQLAKDGKRGWTGNTSMTPMQGVDASPFTFSIDEYGFTSVFGVAQQNQNVKILSAPSIVTTHNKEATVNVSETQALITETTSYETSAYPQTKSTIDWKDIGIILKVTPLIGENGVVQMKITQTVESVVRTQLINDVSQPIIGKREAESFVSAANGETIILAGLQQTKSNKTDGEVFALADIPLIGNLFKPNQEKVERTELIIFIRPTIVKSETAATLIAKEGIEKSQVSKQVKQYFKTGKFHDQDNDTMGKHKYSSLEKTLLHPEDDEKKAEEKDETSDAKKEEVKSDNQSETKTQKNAQLVE